MINGSGANGNGTGTPATGNIMEALLALLLSEKMGNDFTTTSTDTPRSPATEAMRRRIQEGMNQE